MALVNVQLGEVIVGQLHFRAVHDLKAHADEDLLDLVKNVVHGVLVADGLFFAGQAHVQRLVPQFFLQQRGGKLGFARLDGVFNVASQLVCQLAHGGALLGGELTHLAQNGGQFALFTQIFHAQRLQQIHILCFGYGLEGGLSQPLHQFFHFSSPQQKNKASVPKGTKAMLPRYHPNSARAAL